MCSLSLAKVVTGAPAAPVPLTPLPPSERYAEAFEALTAQDRFGTDLCKLDLPGLVMWLCYLGGY